MARVGDWYKNQAHQTAVSQLCVEVEKGETLAYAVEASASTAMPTKKRQLRVKHRQQEGTEPDKGTVRDRNRRVQPTPGERSSDRNLGAPYQPQYGPPRIKWEKHERGRYRERSAQEKTAEQRSPQRKDNAGTRAGRQTPWNSREMVKED